MALIVQKFGGSSVATTERILHVAEIITNTYKQGNDVVVVLSAQGDTTDDLLAKAYEINPYSSTRELDMLLTPGDPQSIAQMAMAIERLDCPVISLTGWQVGLETTSTYGAARIKRIVGTRMKEELNRKNIVLVAGFQGVNKYGDQTTLGRGGSDTTAVALAVSLKADLCQIYTDVDGVFTADPRKVPGARKIKEITFDEMLELASLGAQVLHNRSVEMAKRYNMNMEVLSSFTGAPGTIVKEAVKQVEQTYISGVASDKNIARIALVGLEDQPGVAYRVFNLLAKEKINVDIILQSIGRSDSKDISFTVDRKVADRAYRILADNREMLGYDHVDINQDVAKVSVVGGGMVDNPGVAATMFEALYEAHINIKMISTSEIKVSVLISKDDTDRAVAAIHDKFFL